MHVVVVGAFDVIFDFLVSSKASIQVVYDVLVFPFRSIFFIYNLMSKIILAFYEFFDIKTTCWFSSCHRFALVWFRFLRWDLNQILNLIISMFIEILFIYWIFYLILLRNIIVVTLLNILRIKLEFRICCSCLQITSTATLVDQLLIFFSWNCFSSPIRVYYSLIYLFSRFDTFIFGIYVLFFLDNAFAEQFRLNIGHPLSILDNIFVNWFMQTHCTV